MEYLQFLSAPLGTFMSIAYQQGGTISVLQRETQECCVGAMQCVGESKNLNSDQSDDEAPVLFTTPHCLIYLTVKIINS